MKNYKKLEDYGIIGNLDTAALVASDGSIDWCCFPHIESPSVFAALLDKEKGGYFSVTPVGTYQSSQGYIDRTNVLQTKFTTATGSAVLTDFMPLKGWDKADKQSHQAIYRKLTCEEGRIEMNVDFQPCFDYARAKTVLKLVDKGILATSNGEHIFLKSLVPLQIKRTGAAGVFSMKTGDVVWLALQYGHERPLETQSGEELLETTLKFWLDWVHSCEEQKCVFGGPWHDLIVRSGLVLKLLNHQETGAISAALTTSLPEVIGGKRNWDYRYNWIRDASFTVQALYNVGHIEEAKNHLSWFMGICQALGDISKTQILYGLHGESSLEEEELPHLSGYRNSWPVRVGNGAVDQKQIDVYGELVSAIYDTSRFGEEITEKLWRLVIRIVNYVINIWTEKDSGIWEVRSRPQNFVYSKLMCWVALDRGIKIAKLRDKDFALDTWTATRDEIKKAIIEKGFSKRLNSFVQSFESEHLDATVLLIPLMGLLPFDDPKVQSTVDAVFNELLSDDGLVYRYKNDDGLPGREGAFILCSFWLVDVLALSGRVEEAERIFNGVIKHIGPLGLLAEEINVHTGKMLGNYPQAFSHIGLINSALYLGKAKGKKAKLNL